MKELLLVQGLSMMEQPFGADTLDMPGLSYVCAAAEMSLRTVAHHDNSNALGFEKRQQTGAGDGSTHLGREVTIMDHLQKLDEMQLLADVPEEQRAQAAMVSRSRTRQSTVDKRDSADIEFDDTAA